MTTSAMSKPRRRGGGTPRKLTKAERRRLEQFIADPDTPARQARRARIVLEASTGAAARVVAARLGTSPATVELWTQRFAEFGPAGLSDRLRPGRPRFADRRGRRRALAPEFERDIGATGSVTDATLEQLLRAASQTIGRRGIAATRVADIAQQASVSTATVHYYFNTKQEILVQALLWANARSMAGRDVFNPHTGDPLARLAGLIERSMPYEGTQKDEYLLEIDLWSCVRLHPELLRAWERYHRRWIDGVTAIISNGIEQGLFRVNHASAEEIAQRLVALTDGLSDQSAIGAQSMPAARVRTLVISFAADQLGIATSTLEAALAARTRTSRRSRVRASG